MAGVQKGPDAFFRIGPAVSGTAICFAVRRGEINRRFDPANHRPDVRAKLAKLGAVPTEELRSIAELCYRYPTFYGFEYASSPGVLVLKGENITRDGDLRDTEEPSYISEEIHQRYPKTHLQADDLIVSVRGEVGKVGLIPADLAGSNINANTIRIKLYETAKRDSFLPRFVWLYLNSDLGQLCLRQFIAGGVQETITAPELLQVRIPRLSIPKQSELVITMDAARAARREKIAQADSLLAGLDAFLLETLALAPPPKDNRRVFAVRRSDVQQQGRLNADYFHPERILALRSMDAAAEHLDCRRLAEVVDFVRDQIQTPTSNYLSLANVQSQTGELVDSNEEVTGACSVYKTGDVLFARLRPYLNKVYRAEMNGCCSPEFHVLRVRDTSTLQPDYLAAILRSGLILAQTRHMMTGNTHPRLTNDDVVNLIIPIPKRDSQDTIATEVRRRRDEARRLRLDAEKHWRAAKQWFEEQLLRPDQK